MQNITISELPQALQPAARGIALSLQDVYLNRTDVPADAVLYWDHKAVGDFVDMVKDTHENIGPLVKLQKYLRFTGRRLALPLRA